jgi:thiol-disulfide isomerase/thioredoxin
MRKTILVIFTLSLTLLVNSQYHIEFNIKPLNNDTLILAHYFNKTFSIQDTGILNDEGHAILSGEKPLPQGLYIVYISPSLRFDIIIGEDQNFSLSTDTTDFINETSVSGSEENSLFFEYQVFLSEKRNIGNSLQERMTNPVSVEDSLEARVKFDEINETVKEFTEGIIARSQNMFLGKFLLALKEVSPPPAPLNENGEPIDPHFPVKYIKEHYWDYFDLSDVRMLRTPFYESKLQNYLDNWIHPSPDSIYHEVDFLIAKSRSDTLLFKYMLTTLFNHFARSKFVGMDAVYIYIAVKYYLPEASWADPEFVKSLRDRVQKQSPLLIGKLSPDVQLVSLDDNHFRLAAMDTTVKNDPYAGTMFNLHSVKAKYTLLYFWEPECGHCTKVIPQLYEVYKRNKDKGFQVVAVNILGYPKKAEWVDFVNQHQLYGWINAWNPYNISPSYRELYNIESSNILYLLDENKNIIIKFVGPEEVENIISKGI